MCVGGVISWKASCRELQEQASDQKKVQKHKHTRVNRYRAVYTIVQETGNWRIADTKMRNMERIRRATDEELLNGSNQGGGYLDPLDLIDAGILDSIEENDDD